MAGTTVNKRRTATPESDAYHVVEEHNNVITDLETLRAAGGDGLLQIGTLLISGAAAAKYKTTTVAYWRRLGIQFTKAATDNLTFGTAYTINTGTAVGSYWGAFLIQTTDTGTVTGLAVSADQVYTSEALAVAALPSAAAGNVALGYITVNANDDAAWTADTDDMTDGSDCVTADFYDAAVLGTTAASGLVAAEVNAIV